ncbi:F0F1 ATP synthase subunit A [Albimonas sp. CAU 1670]|uniref:F0F1 ATP synthase subunit A n=1 Tax=Albimonas sp. CAU 1670 TaxID=3032599 RepID=UPI0023DC4E28|nr:F0F1 ATP synthase subunit A [Albimonas sp. CAU 1670]MDF2235457.1 F0F1 ATP synthase subunit A [Albimonas sp. CAU 1670]
MMESPLLSPPIFHLGPLAVTAQVATTWGLMAALGVLSWLATRRLSTHAPSRLQAALEFLVATLDAQIRDTVGRDPARYRALIGMLLVFILAANWSSLIPGVEPPTAHLETTAALAALVFVATTFHGVRAQGPLGYLKSFTEPAWILAPLNLIEQLTRAFSLMVRLFGNVMSGVFVIGILLSLAGLLVPIPLMALDLLTGAVQAYIFATLACVFIASAVNGEGGPKGDRP